MLDYKAIEFIEARQDHYGFLHALYAEIHSWHAQNRPELYDSNTRDLLTAESLAAIITDPLQWMGIARADDMPIGFVHLVVKDKRDSAFEANNYVGSIEAIGVDAACRGQGIGRLILHEAEEKAYQLGATYIKLQVQTFNEAAIHLYKIKGYDIIQYHMGKVIGNRE